MVRSIYLKEPSLRRQLETIYLASSIAESFRYVVLINIDLVAILHCYNKLIL